MNARIYYVIGASGVGKDSLIAYARAHRPAAAPVVFAHRYITRPADAGGENHVALSEQEFAQRRQHGGFAMAWQSHGLYYGIGSEIISWVAQGLHVVINGSRAYLEQAARDFPDLIPVLVHTSTERLRRRLEARGRESGAQIEARLARAAELDRSIRHPALLRLDNSDDLDVAGRRLMTILYGSVS